MRVAEDIQDRQGGGRWTKAIYVSLARTIDPKIQRKREEQVPGKDGLDLHDSPGSSLGAGTVLS